MPRTICGNMKVILYDMNTVLAKAEDSNLELSTAWLYQLMMSYWHSMRWTVLP